MTTVAIEWYALYSGPELFGFITFFFFKKKIFFFYIYLFLRDREIEHMWGGAEREGDKIQSTEPDEGLELTNCEIMT